LCPSRSCCPFFLTRPSLQTQGKEREQENEKEAGTVIAELAMDGAVLIQEFFKVLRQWEVRIGPSLRSIKVDLPFRDFEKLSLLEEYKALV
jgi:hypothetical protein